MSITYLSICLVTTVNYEGNWIQKPGEISTICYKNAETTLTCELGECSTNCVRSYNIQGYELSLSRDSNVTGNYDGDNEIRWDQDETWKKQGLSQLINYMPACFLLYWQSSIKS